MSLHTNFDASLGKIIEQWDDDTLTYTDFRTDPPTTRPYDERENERAASSVAAAAHEETGNAVTAIIEDMKAERDAMQAIIDKPNEEIEGAVAFNIKEVARSAKKMASAEIDLAKYVKGL